MSHRVYELEPGLCTCVVGDPYAGSRKVPVRKVSAEGILLDPSCNLRLEQFVYTSVVLRDGPAMALTGVVAATEPAGTYIQWTQGKPEETNEIDRKIRSYLEERGKLPPAPPEPAKPPAPPPEPPKPALPRPQPERSRPVPHSGQPERGPAGKAHPLKPHGAKPEAHKTPAPKAPAPQHPPRRHAAPAAAAAAPGAPVAAQLDVAGQRIDVGAHIRRKAKVMRSADLASKLETVQVLNVGTIKALIKDAVDEAVALHGQTLAEEERRRLLEEAEESFRERYEAEKANQEEKTRLLQKQLEKAQSVLKEERQRVLSARQFTVSDTGLVELEQRLGRLLDLALRKGEVGGELEREMRSVVAKLLDDEREKIRSQAQEAQSDRVALLEKKVQRLATSLQDAEAERDKAKRWAEALEASGGIAFRNLMKVGLDDADPRREKKLGLLKEIVELNRNIRKELAAAGKLPPLRQAAAPAAKAGAPPQRPEGQPPADMPAPAAEVKTEAPAPAKETGEEADKVPVLATGGDVDPDDLAWEPPAGPAPAASQVKIHKLGGDS